ncbi:MAG: hypothetical protein N2C12_03870, partial [Planctomycetales bacterium]
VRSEALSNGSFSGDIRIDPAPRWNRANNTILVPGIAKDNTRQMFMIQIVDQGDPRISSVSGYLAPEFQLFPKTSSGCKR